MSDIQAPVILTPTAGIPIIEEPLTTANIDKRVWKLAIPAIGENLLATSLMIVDTLMISRFGNVPIAASAVAGVIVWRSFMTLGCIERGTTAMVARYYGERNMERLCRTVAQSIYMAAGIGLILSVLGAVYSEQLLRWMKAPPDVVIAGKPFLQVIFLASIPRMFFFVAAASIRGAGDTRSPMWITLWMNVINIVLNYLLIFGHFGFPKLGLLGSGISTAFAILFSAVAILWVMFSGRSHFRLRARHFRFDPGLLRTMWRISFPSFFEELIISAGFLLFFTYIATMGTDILSAHRVSTNIESLSFMAGFGFSIAASTLVGQSLGMGRVDLARTSFRRTTALCVIVMSVVAVFLIVFGRQVVMAFAPEYTFSSPAAAREFHQLAYTLLVIAALEQPLLGVTMTLSGALRGAGDTISPMITSFVGTIIVRAGVCYVLAFTLNFGIYGVYVGTAIDWALRSTILFYLYKTGRWSRIKV